MNKIDVFSIISLILMSILLIIVVSHLRPELLSKALGPLVPPKDVIRFETSYVWRERGLDTLLQTIPLAAALLGVLIYMVRVRRGGE